MQSRLIGLLIGLAVVVASPILFAQNPRPRQGAAPAAEVKPTPRLPDGKPDLHGVWGHRGAARYFTPGSSVMSADRTEVAATTAEMAMRPEAKAKYAAQLQAGKIRTIERDLFDPTIKACAPPGPSRIIARGSPFEIIQLSGRVLLRYEMDHWVRDVWMDGRRHPPEQPSSWMGHSIGRWEGDTLVVETVGMNNLTTLDSPGHPHSEALRLEERYTRVNHDTLEIQTLFDDPEIYTKPLEGTKLTWRLVPNGEIGEWVSCDDRIPLLMETDVCKITGAWEYEAYCIRREKGLPIERLSAPGAPASGY